ncbi:MAG: hypothetical protein KatS3mg021_1651 [Fimbriimonadales bacterium]|jgi:anti-sigma factor RsiW|nr:MAG: hypothetical protein KatS3mg021_1651 [Fimbriimonadales bacterium]
MNCRRAREHIEAYVFGDLDSALAEALEEHLKRCSDCRRLVEEQRKLMQALRRLFALQGHRSA